jgi:hypothetical protein
LFAHLTTTTTTKVKIVDPFIHNRHQHSQVFCWKINYGELCIRSERTFIGNAGGGENKAPPDFGFIVGHA